MNQVRSRRTLMPAVLALLVAGAAFAQSDYGSISGFVKDPTGGVIPKSKVVVKNEATSEERTIIANESGYYTQPNLQPGLYTVTAEAAGFKKFSSTHNKLDPDSALSLDATLTVGATTETVDVTATAATLQTESASVEKDITREQIDSLELNGRDPLYLASLLPGVRSGSTMGDFSFSLTSGGYSVNGARSQDTQILFDGAPALRTRANGTG